MREMTAFSRRRFLLSAAAASAGFLGLRALYLGQGQAVPIAGIDRHGPLASDPDGILDLPRGFSYRVLSRTGDRMSDGLPTPGAPDGMAAFEGPGGRIILVRNHEIGLDQGALGPFGEAGRPPSWMTAGALYDPGRGGVVPQGGATTLVYDPRSGAVERQFLSLAGTLRNCAGGPTPWGAWLSCEETLDRAGPALARDHGYVFEVPASAAPALAAPVPLRGMGRFRHEAAAVDPRTGIVYMTEDQADGLFYRYVPARPGRLAEGGRLEALALRGAHAADLRNWPGEGAAPVPCGAALSVRWVALDGTDAPTDDLRVRGHERGAAIFARGEGMWAGRDGLYFSCTMGGATQAGQIWRYQPGAHEGRASEDDAPGVLELFIEPNDDRLLQNCDNLTVTPWGDLIVCEDGPGDQHLRGVTPEGLVYTIARVAHPTRAELTGVCASPGGRTVFLNLQRPGITLAIEGPWGRA